MNSLWKGVSAWLVAALLLLPLGFAQDSAKSPSSSAVGTPAKFKPEELEQLVAPIALYPDSLVAQVLMASTYPLEIVEATRWSKANPNLKDKALQDALEKQKWDPSVKSLTAFPQTLQMLNEKLDMTQKLGDAFLAQQKDVLDAVQRLRAKAQAAGNLKSSKEQNVTTEQQGSTTVIKIEPADPQVVYVPTYNPTVVYGPWPYPAYPPYYYYPPGYVPGAAFFTFTLGIAIGANWGNCNWGGGNVYIDNRKYNNFNRTDIKTGDRGDWQHNPEHRRGVEYRDQGSRDKFGGGQRPGVDSREQFRGRAEAGQRDIARGGADQFKGGGVGDRGSGDFGGRGGDFGGPGDRGGAPDRSAMERSGGGAFDGAGRGSQSRDFSNRGASSRGFSGGGGGFSGGGGRGGGGRGGGRR
ncbi:MAG TPA: DUF3300 domain-containing protein [Burkholderiales bacterium]|nr:DUF3300 domain-containing protein [Burkholderiales bacterium]